MACQQLMGGIPLCGPVTVRPHEPVLPLLPPAPDPTPGAPRRSTILIVDDEPFNVDYLEQALAELGYETLSATNGQEALDKVAADAPDLILLDVMMPVMDGFTVCRLLKDQEETRLIPIVIMTALDAKADRITGIQAGADDFLTKPVDEAELVARIETALKLKHTVDRRLGEFSALKDQVAQLVRFVTPRDSPRPHEGMRRGGVRGEYEMSVVNRPVATFVRFIWDGTGHLIVDLLREHRCFRRFRAAALYGPTASLDNGSVTPSANVSHVAFAH